MIQLSCFVGKDKIPDTSGIYAIKNTKNGKVYVGSSVNINRRIKDHFRDLENGEHHSIKLQRAYSRAKDKSIFEPCVLELVSEKSELFAREQYWIDKFDAFNSGYNCSAFADNPKYTSKRSVRAKAASAYDKFLKLYDETRMSISSYLLSRIQYKHYKRPPIIAISSLLECLLNTYKSEEYKFSIGFRRNSMYIDVIGADGNRFVEYEWKKNKPHVGEEMTTMIREYLSKKGLLNESLHAILPIEEGGETI